MALLVRSNHMVKAKQQLLAPTCPVRCMLRLEDASTLAERLLLELAWRPVAGLPPLALDGIVEEILMRSYFAASLAVHARKDRMTVRSQLSTAAAAALAKLTDSESIWVLAAPSGPGESVVVTPQGATTARHLLTLESVAVLKQCLTSMQAPCDLLWAAVRTSQLSRVLIYRSVDADPLRQNANALIATSPTLSIPSLPGCDDYGARCSWKALILTLMVISAMPLGP